MKTRNVLLAVLLVMPLWSQSPADLLQKGIYTQETVGDLDGAIKIYRQIVSASSESRAYAAQAQFRIAQCLMKKGSTAEATQAFKTLISTYPEQTELVARARAYVPASMELLPAPWADSEVLEYSLTAQNGMKAGKLVMETTVTGATSTTESRMYYLGMIPGITRVQFNSESMRPTRESLVMRPMLDVAVEVDSGQAKVMPAGKEPRVVPLDGPVFTNEQITQLVRRLPLRDGYKVTVPILSVVGMVMKLELTATGPEEISVPAGKFRCFKVDVISQNIWVAADGTRPVVKLSAMGVTTELTAVRSQRETAGESYRSENQRFALELPAGWSTMAMPSGPDWSQILLADPEANSMTIVMMVDKKTNPQIAKDLRDSVDEIAKQKVSYYKDYTVRPESIQTLQIAGQQAIRAIADYTEGGRKITDYLIFVRSANSRVNVTTKVEAADLEAFRKRFDPIVQTLQMP